MKIPKIEYDVYSKLSGNNLVKLNLSICKDIKIYLSIPISITEYIDELNSSSGYYNDICYIATSESGSDIILKDRKVEFVEKNKTVCQDHCDFSNYNYSSKKANCSCNVKESSSSIFDNMIINRTKLYENFKDVKNLINLGILVCYKVLFNKNSILYNVGSYIIIAIIFFHLIFSFIFFIKELKELNEKIKEIISALKNLKEKGKEDEKIETKNPKKSVEKEKRKRKKV